MAGRKKIGARARVERDAIWAEVRKLEEFSAQDVSRLTRVQLSPVRTYLGALERSGRLSTIEQGPPRRWRLVRDTGPQTPRLRADGSEIAGADGRDRLWTAMRVMKVFSVEALRAHAAPRDGAGLSLSTVERYCSALAHAGYLRARRSGGEQVYQLVLDTGPRAPQLITVLVVRDANAGIEMWRDEDRGDRA